MKNITISVSDGVYRAARVYAAEHDTSVSGLVADYLSSLSQSGGEFERLEAQQRRIQAEIEHFAARDPLVAVVSDAPSEASSARLGREDVHERAVR